MKTRYAVLVAIVGLVLAACGSAPTPPPQSRERRCISVDTIAPSVLASALHPLFGEDGD
jgi:hypothetical protein